MEPDEARDVLQEATEELIPVIKTEQCVDMVLDDTALKKHESEEATQSRESGHDARQHNWSSVKCVFCQQVLTAADEPKLLECLHASCSACIATKFNEQNQADGDVVGENVVICPNCMVPCRSSHMIENHFLLEGVGTAEGLSDSGEASKLNAELKCGSCPELATATSWCVECADYICDACVQAHQRLKITKEHTIKPKEEGELEANAFPSGGIPKSLYCSVHSQENIHRVFPIEALLKNNYHLIRKIQEIGFECKHNLSSTILSNKKPHDERERLSLFCETCDRLTCRDCQLTEHREHKYKFINEIAAETRSVITGLLSEVTYKRVLLRSAMKVIDDRQSLIIEKKKQIVKEITNMVVKLTNTINARGKQLVVRLNQVCDTKQQTLSEKKQALEQLSNLTDHCIDFVKMALAEGSDMALLATKSNVTTHLQRIKSRRADIPNPEIPVRITLALDKVPDLIKVASTIGAIVVDGRAYPTTAGPIPPTTVAVAGPSRPPSAPQAYSVSAPLQIAPPPQAAPPPSQSRAYASPPSTQHHSHPPPPYSHARGGPLQAMNNLARGMVRPGCPIQVMGMRPHQPHQQQVTSSTHPHNSQLAAVEANLRGLLSHTYQQQQSHPSYPGSSYMYRMPSQTVTSPGYSTGPPNVSLMHPQRQYMQQQLHQQLQQHQYQQMHQSSHQQHQQQQQAGRAYSTAARQLVQRVQSHSPQSSSQHHRASPQTPPSSSSGITWHIPQQHPPTEGGSSGQSRPLHAPLPPPLLQLPVNDSYKITLKQQSSSGSGGSVPSGKVTPGGGVTSSVPKTPSPNAPAKATDDAEKSIDKFCQESVDDLMLAIAKLDNNGIVVIPEQQKGGGGRIGDSPLVDSSTGPPNDSALSSGQPLLQSDSQKDDPNEDWCAVCMDGGDLICCDNCPKVFHVNCHVPPLRSFPEESERWQCLLCTNLCSSTVSSVELGTKRTAQGMPEAEQVMAERILLELFCQYEPSVHFRELVSPENTDYYDKIKNPMSFEMIRRKLDRTSPTRYTDLRRVIQDIRLVFRNAYCFNHEESIVYSDAKTLEEFLDSMLHKYLPHMLYEETLPATMDDHSEDESFAPAQKVRRVITD